MKLPDPIKSGISTAAFTFVGLFVPALLGWLNSLYNAVSQTGHGTLPSISTLGYAAASAAVAAVTGLVTSLFRWAQGQYDFVPGQPPTFNGGK